jgi:hypothetical protein
MYRNVDSGAMSGRPAGVSKARSQDSQDWSTDKVFGFRYRVVTRPPPKRGRSQRTIWLWPAVFVVVLVVGVGSLFGAGLFSSIFTGGPCNTLDCGGQFRFGSANPVGPLNGSLGECAETDFCYEILIAYASGGLTPSNLQFKLTTNISTLLPIVSWYIDGANLTLNGYLSSPVNPSGTWTATPGVSGTAAEITNSTKLTSGMEIWIDVSATVSPYGTGARLYALGQGSFSGLLSITLP